MGVASAGAGLVISAELAYAYTLGQEYYEHYQEQLTAEAIGNSLTLRIKYAQNVYAIKLYGRAMIAAAAQAALALKSYWDEQEDMQKLLNAQLSWASRLMQARYFNSQDPNDPEIWTALRAAYFAMLQYREILYQCQQDYPHLFN